MEVDQTLKVIPTSISAVLGSTFSACLKVLLPGTHCGFKPLAGKQVKIVFCLKNSKKKASNSGRESSVL